MHLIFTISFILIGSLACGQVKIRLFTDSKPVSVIFSVTQGKYALSSFDEDTLYLTQGDPVIIAKYNGRLAVKSRNKPGFIADSLILTGISGDASFSLKADGNAVVRQYYTGDLKCIADMETILLINSVDEDKYIAGVVRAEGGPGKHIEFFKTQAVLARTYMYKYINKHISDGYNLCDDIHCQVYSGICSEPVIINAVKDTKGVVVLDRKGILIISAFHSNCGGETASSEEVWLTSVPYLKRVKDPYCTASRNASWKKTFAGDEWLSMIRRVSHSEIPVTLAQTAFNQNSRATYYNAGIISIPLKDIRTYFNLRSTFFSVVPANNNVVLNGRGYGHGVGLCQEGAMVMAANGLDYRQIIDFYFHGVIIADISKAVPEIPIK